MTDNKLTPEQQAMLNAQLAALREQLKAELVEELKDEETKRRERLAQKREEERKSREEYVNKMKESPEPWVDILGMVDTPQGIRIELEWNDAFIEHLRKNGIRGTDDDAMVQKWVILLLRDMADDMEENTNPVGRGASDFT
jgi:hypothetical protein